MRALYPQTIHGRNIYHSKHAHRIPICAVAGSTGKTTVTQLLNRVLIHYLGVISDRGLEAAVLEIDPNGIRQHGLGYDESDVAVITNIHAEYLPSEGFCDLAKMTWLHSAVVRGERERGSIVLNADDPSTIFIKSLPELKLKKLILFSLYSDGGLLKDHLQAGGSAAWMHEGIIFFSENGTTGKLVRLDDVPMAQVGRARFQVANILAAFCAAKALGVLTPLIVETLKNFDPGLQNWGRLSLYKILTGTRFWIRGRHRKRSPQ